MYNPYALPHENKGRTQHRIIGCFLAIACILETLGFWGGFPNPPLAVFYGIASVYTLRT